MNSIMRELMSLAITLTFQENRYETDTVIHQRDGEAWGMRPATLHMFRREKCGGRRTNTRV
jgi:hypothetical protein